MRLFLRMAVLTSVPDNLQLYLEVASMLANLMVGWPSVVLRTGSSLYHTQEGNSRPNSRSSPSLLREPYLVAACSMTKSLQAALVPLDVYIGKEGEGLVPT